MTRLLLLLVSLVLPGVAAAQIEPLAHAGMADDNFGGAVALGDSLAVVGASNEDVCGPGSGAAYVFAPDSTARWHETARLVAPDCAPGQYFGRSVAVQGNRVLVSASGEFFASRGRNAVYLFAPDTAGTWAVAHRFPAPTGVEEGTFGTSVALGDGVAVITSGGDAGEPLVAGAAYVYEQDAGGAWQQVARLEAPGGTQHGVFGARAALDGDRLLVTAPGPKKGQEGSLWIFERFPDGAWRVAGHLGGFRDGPLDADLSGDDLAAGESQAGDKGAGRVVLMRRQPTGAWHQTGVTYAPSPYRDGRFGTRVSLDGDRLLAVAYDEQIGLDFNVDRVVHLFRPDERGAWTARQVIDVGNAFFASDVDQRNGFALVGQARSGAPGAAYVVTLR